MKKSWWWNITVEWPAAFGDWLWLMLVEMPADFLNRLTFRQIIRFLVLVILAISCAHTLPLDLAFLYAGDALVYFEVFTAVSLLAARGRARAIVYVVRRMIEDALRGLVELITFAMRKGASRHPRANSVTRQKRLMGSSGKSDDEPSPISWGIPA